MNRKSLIRSVAYLLLFAMQFAAVPFHQVFHKHNPTSSHDHAGTTSFKTFEKACCHPFDGIFGTCESSHVESGELNFVLFHYAEYSGRIYANQVSQFANKAPPVAIA